jgi:TonB family protein
VVVEVSVDRNGKVIQAVAGIKGSNTLDDYLLRVAKEAAMKATFDPKPDAPVIQKGTITYKFVLK